MGSYRINRRKETFRVPPRFLFPPNSKFSSEIQHLQQLLYPELSEDFMQSLLSDPFIDRNNLVNKQNFLH